MSRSLRFAVVAWCLALGVAQAAPGADDAGPPIVLRAAHLFDGVSGTLVDGGIVVVRGAKIVAVGRDVEVPEGARVVDLGDATLLPGFLDAHVHLTGQMSDDWYRDFHQGLMRFPAEQALWAALYAKRTLEAGFTTVRNVGATQWVDIGLRNAIAAGITEGPRMLTAGHAIGGTAGHADQSPFPPDRVAPLGPIEGICNGPDECRAAVRYQIKFGADVIKFMPSGGVLSESDPVDVPELGQDEMDAIVAEAHAWKRKVAAHCHGDAAAKMAIAAGVDSIEHGTFLEDDTLRSMKERGAYLVPTLSAGWWIGEKLDRFPPVIAAKARAASARMREMFGRAVRLGVPIAFGTDAGVVPHGTNAREFSLMVEAGMAPAEALLAGTRNAADLLGVSDAAGALRPGLAADVVAVPGNPLEDISVTERPVLVMQGGRIVSTIRAGSILH